ncbi:MAG: peptidylprolyl isomerase [Candidatus Uhrbacteria bacterium]|nr:peptidylprolyl isomerase [Candidatus Uhrbacteria bacterium]
MNTRIVTLLVFCFVVLIGVGIYQKMNAKDLETPPVSEEQTMPSSPAEDQTQQLSLTPQPEQNAEQIDNTKNKESLQKSSMEIDASKTYTAVLHTSEGDIEVALNAKETPITANNFVALARKGFYDNTIFHRTMKGFMIQGGDPKGDGTGGPGYRFDDEPFTGEYTRGTVAMANAGPNTNGSQFFIMHADYALPKNYVIFGHVTKGLDVVDKIATAPVATSRSGEPSSPVAPVTVTSVAVSEK